MTWIKDPRFAANLVERELFKEVSSIIAFDPQRTRDQSEYLLGCPTILVQLMQRDSTISFREPLPFWTQDKRRMNVFGSFVSQQLLQVDLPRCRLEKVICSDNLSNFLEFIINDGDKVVGMRAIAAADHKVIDMSRELATDTVGDRQLFTSRLEPQSRSAIHWGKFFPTLISLVVCEDPACARVGTGRGMRGARSIPNVSTSAIALVEQTSLEQLIDDLVVRISPVRLEEDITVPVHADLGKVPQLRLHKLGPAALIEIFHPHHKPESGFAGTSPGYEAGAKVADMEVARRRRRISANPGRR